jgi:hypothetical protein
VESLIGYGSGMSKAMERHLLKQMEDRALELAAIFKQAREELEVRP